MKKKVMELVNAICNTESNCRGIANNQENINALLELKGVRPEEVDVYEIPVNWSSQVVILYQVKATNERRELFAGIGTDGNFYFEDEKDEDAHA